MLTKKIETYLNFNKENKRWTRQNKIKMLWSKVTLSCSSNKQNGCGYSNQFVCGLIIKLVTEVGLMYQAGH